MRLLDAEFGPMPTKNIVAHAVALAPDAVLVGHSGSTSGHPSRQVSRASCVGRVHTPGLFMEGYSRGCPHACSYCGQRGFWTQWRHCDPHKFAAGLAWLYRTHGVEVVNFADENPTASRPVWCAFLEALIAENVPLTLVGSTRADDIVRDATPLDTVLPFGCRSTSDSD